MRGPTPFGTLFGTFLVLKIELKKRYEKGGKIGSPGDPKIKPKSNQGLQKRLRGVFRRPLGKEVEKRVIFRPPGTVKMRLPL